MCDLSYLSSSSLVVDPEANASDGSTSIEYTTTGGSGAHAGDVAGGMVSGVQDDYATPDPNEVAGGRFHASLTSDANPQGPAGDSGASHATQEMQPIAAADMERYPSDSSEKSVRIRAPDSPRSRSSSPRGHHGPHGARAIGGGLPTSTPKMKAHDDSRKSSGSSGRFTNLSAPAILPQDFLRQQAPDREYYEQERKREVDLVRAHLLTLLEKEKEERKHEVEKEKEERKHEVDLEKEERKHEVDLVRAQLEEEKVERKREVEQEKESRKREVEQEKESRKREVDLVRAQLEQEKESRKREVERLMAEVEAWKTEATKARERADMLVDHLIPKST
ncbi:hypothetical protein C8Q73DRAFT_286620 [Cubamyces lactineus]|nr:hypothetical protein C8Q73DRAFT_286620 [Cubamyces lactineus]